MRFFVLIALCFTFFNSGISQPPGYWQQEVDYTMEIFMDVEKNQFQGEQTLVYSNHSPDTLHRVFYHLYYNAFQPGSMMDVRSRTIPDPDKRVRDRIFKLTDEEIGYQKIHSLHQDGEAVTYTTQGTILEVELAQPILPGTSTTFEMRFEAQVPLQVRRTGRDSKEGIRYSMSQWYPKIAQYDQSGWHPTSYIAREFYSVWGDFDVTIHIDPAYVLGGTGDVQDPNAYQDSGNRPTKAKKTWHFIAKNVPDFVWAADPDYTYHTETSETGVQLEFFYQPGEKTQAWDQLPAAMSEAFKYASTHFGPYPYHKYAFIQGGDGGMEYPMATLITGERPLASLVGVSVHEMMHSWYQLVLGSNESLYPWMDEGFTSYGSTRIMNHLRKKGLIPGAVSENPFAATNQSYIRLVESGLEEPMTTHADHYSTNYAYGVAAYTKGALFLNQLEYVVGKEVFDRALLRYFDEWKFKHPTDEDVIRVFEKESGMILDWYREYWVQSLKWIDYAIQEVEGDEKTTITLQRKGKMPMPIDVYVQLKDGREVVHTIPLVMMRNTKSQDGDLILKGEKPWPWVNPEYTLEVDVPLEQIEQITIDKSSRMVDVNVSNNKWTNQSRP
ncbi:M1 family metallopeptidase [Membranicola marinus]|uniref:M1 family metallopeptidase n=1 Tax=Membranihabitans marinus TaxID=1227546 RepID=A0A953L5X3_9BACT|nr:M1 family metallopeptidase [Membranihabitans marinus]MBY5957042.1 M1 family metallopeptidase [Membranihabitans marinus]